MSDNTILALVALITALGNIIYQFYQAWKKTKPEIKKMAVEADSEVVEASRMTLEGAEISSKLLMNRIEELKTELDAEKESRREDKKYFIRRLRELDKELRDYRMWSAQLAKQVIEAGKIPAPFMPALDTDRGLSYTNPDEKANK